jgi:hypothetical protein
MITATTNDSKKKLNWQSYTNNLGPSKFKLVYVYYLHRSSIPE